MKRITNSFIKNIVRQSLNESYGLLNEQDPSATVVAPLEKCPAGGFCIGDKSYSAAKALYKTKFTDDYVIDHGQEIVNLCANEGMGSTKNNSIISSIVDKIALQYSYTDADEDAVTNQINRGLSKNIRPRISQTTKNKRRRIRKIWLEN